MIGTLRVEDGFETRLISIPGAAYCNNYCDPVSEIKACLIHPIPLTGGSGVKVIEGCMPGKTRQTVLEWLP